MEKKIVPVFILLLSLSFISSSYSYALQSITGNDLISKEDSVRDKINLKIIKINPIQALFSEIPVSFEVFHKLNRSTQFQFGFIFPYNQAFPPRRVFESSGKNANASSVGLLSYRKSPYNNYGGSLKIEFRNYRKFLYYAPQIMIKYCYYNKLTFPVNYTSLTWDQTESKSSVIFGFGYMIGRQSNYRTLVVDRYAGVGFRLRSLSYRIIEIRNPWNQQYNKYPNEEGNSVSFYPFINLGIRIGIKL